MQAIVAGALKRNCRPSAKIRLLADIEAEDIAEYQHARLAEEKRPSNRAANMEVGTLRKVPIHAGTGRTVPLNARALRTLQFWASQFQDRKPEHYVFPVVRYGLYGKKGQVGKGGEVEAYETDSTRPVGTIQSAWEAAKRRTQQHCPGCAVGELTERKPAKRKRSEAWSQPLRATSAKAAAIPRTSCSTVQPGSASTICGTRQSAA